MNAAAWVAVIVAVVAVFFVAGRRRSRPPGTGNRCEHCGFAALPPVWQRCPACGENL